MPEKFSTTWNNLLFYGALALGIGLMLYGYLPVPYTIYVQPNDGSLRTADAITSQTPLQQCIDGDFENITSIDLLLATYARTNFNTNHYQIFTIEQGHKRILREGDFDSGSVKDNDYFSIDFRPIETMGEGDFCFLLTSTNATTENQITYWLNGQSQPVLKLKSTVPLHKAIEQIINASRFDLPMWLAVGLCLLYLFANISVIFLIWHEYRQSSKQVSKAAPPHSRRTR
jgi:hypothetical protein